MKVREHVVTVKLSAPLHARIGRIAKTRQATRSRVIREAIEAGLEESARGDERSFYALTSALAGSASGPGDLSTNPKYMKNFGK